ncbi:MAG: GtrA family protein [Proteobacteria bacterium]|nr:GtrA family protein [Desulfobulbaceae bacterium]MBU4154043.1 GtrA family protein [Pseudomonadota bacterium]MDP2106333.1 GtrA family protein [Desulfobulbaceae bacterium]
MLYGAIRKELILYLVVGVTGLALDALSFYCFRTLGWGLALANITARHIGAVYTFWVNRAVTFSRSGGGALSLGREAALYLFLLYASMAVSTFLLWALIETLSLSEHFLFQTMGKIGVDGCCALANFAVCKWVIFTPHMSTKSG